MLRAVTLLLVCLSPVAAQKSPFDVKALLGIARIAEPQLSPDGTKILFTAGTPDVEKNTRPRQIYSVPVDGGTPVVLTQEGTINERPRWSPDSKQVAFISNRSGSPQVWLMNADGSSPKQITTIATEAGGVMFAGDGKNLVFTSEVWPDCPDEACNSKRLEEEKQNKVKARTYTSLLYRHWNDWQSARRRHIFVVAVEGGPAKDLTPGPRETPPFSLGGPDDYAIAPDGSELCYVMNPDTDLATSTNSELYVVPLEGGEGRKITLNPGADNSPLYSPDGKHIAYRTQTKPGYESDKWRLVVMDRSTGKANIVTELLDRSVSSFTWTPDSTRLVISLDDRGRSQVQMMAVAGGSGRSIINGASHVDDMQFTPDGKTLIYTEQSGSRPVEIFKASSTGGAPVPLTRINDAHLAKYHLTPFQDFWVEGAERAKVHTFWVKPPDFRPGQKYPVLFLIHGGPQSAWSESWSYRWNPQVFASAGFVVVMPNPRGSTGYGQRFTDDINSDWGGKVYDDIMAVVDHVSAQSWADPERFAAAGGSYGGYMMNWMLGHANRFKALVSHAGVFDLRSMALETEEIWFPRWEFRGMPWDNPEVYERWSPSNFIKEFKTPTLVVHGELDYRVPVGQGLQLFTALQMMKVPSKLVLFPDEGHWILKPQNSEFWYKQFLDWVTEWTRKPDPPPPPATPATSTP